MEIFGQGMSRAPRGEDMNKNQMNQSMMTFAAPPSMYPGGNSVVDFKDHIQVDSVGNIVPNHPLAAMYPYGQYPMMQGPMNSQCSMPVQPYQPMMAAMNHPMYYPTSSMAAAPPAMSHHMMNEILLARYNALANPSDSVSHDNPAPVSKNMRDQAVSKAIADYMHKQ